MTKSWFIESIFDQIYDLLNQLLTKLTLKVQYWSNFIFIKTYHGKSRWWDEASRNETNKVLTIYLVIRSAGLIQIKRININKREERTSRSPISNNWREMVNFVTVPPRGGFLWLRWLVPLIFKDDQETNISKKDHILMEIPTKCKGKL